MIVPGAGLATIPLGVQPEEDGRLLCRVCGRWYRALGHHVLRKHEMSADDYRERFELPAGRGLAAVDLREAQAHRGSELVATVAAVRSGFLLDEAMPVEDVAAERDRRLAAGRESPARARAGVRAVWTQQGQQLGAARRDWAADRREQLDAEARALAYDDFAALVAQTRHLTHRQFAAVLGWTGTEGLARATWWRLQHGGTSRAYQAAAQQRAAQQRAGLDQVPPGEQPARLDVLRCLECGAWFADLAPHVRNKYQLTAEQYRTRHALPAATVLQAPGCRKDATAQLAGQARRGGQAAGRRKSEAARARWDLAAQQHDYGDIVAMLRAKTNAEITALLGLGRGQAFKLRERYLSQREPGSAVPGEEARRR